MVTFHQLSAFASILFLAALSFLTACSADAASQDASPAPNLACTPVDPGRWQAYAQVADNKVKLAELPVCDTLPPEKYTDLGVPPGATIVIGGGAADDVRYLAATSHSDSGIAFYLGTGQRDAPLAFVLVARYASGQFEIMRPLRCADLAGFYTHAAADSAFVLFLGMQDTLLTGRLFGKAGPLPDMQNLSRELRHFATGRPFIMECQLDRMAFRGAVGRGSLHWRPDTAALIFSSFRGEEGEVVFGKVK